MLLIAALPWSIAPMSIGVVSSLILTGLMWVRSGIPRDRILIAWPAAAWLLAMAASAVFAVDRTASLARLGKGLLPLLVPVAAFHAGNRGWGPRALALLLTSSAAAAAFGVISFLSHGASFTSRARGAVGHYMTFGGQLLLLVSLALGVLATSRDRRWRWGAALAAGIGSVALACTFTRSAWLGWFVACVTILGVRRPRWLLPFSAALAVVVAVSPGAFRERLVSSFDPGHPNNIERTYMWRAGWAMFRDRPWTGVGLQDLRPVYPGYRVPEARETPGHLHSNLVQIAATMGSLGLAAFLFLYGSLFAAAGRGLRARVAAGDLAGGVQLGVVAGLAGFLAAGAFEWNFGDEELLDLLYVLVGLAWAARRWPATPPDAR
jgi:O-antigen ligase